MPKTPKPKKLSAENLPCTLNFVSGGENVTTEGQTFTECLLKLSVKGSSKIILTPSKDGKTTTILLRPIQFKKLLISDIAQQLFEKRCETFLK